jgi:N-acetylglucosaminyldiphosphoundecaprenol N-acetyl-beta-D-mannosaminyltransferase
MPLISTQLVETTLFGIRLNAGDMTTAVDSITQFAKSAQGGLVCVANVDMLTRAKRTPRLARIMQGARAVVTDGMPLVWALKTLQGINSAHRVYGPQLMLELCSSAEKQSIGIFLYGGTPHELALLQQNLLQQFPKLKIAGALSPPMLPTEPPFDAAVVKTINDSGAGMAFIGLGCPKQEFWMDAHQAAIKPVAIGVGLAFAHIAGTKKSAPVWMQANGLEWLYRLGQEPGRLWKRYLVGNALFVGHLLRAAFVRDTH